MPSSTCKGIRDTDQDPELNNWVFHFPSPCSFPLKGDKHCLNFAFSSALYCLLIGPFSKRWQEDVISSLKAVIWGLHLSPYSSGGSMLNAATLRSFANASPEAALPTPRGRQFLTVWTTLGPTRCWATFPAYVFFFLCHQQLPSLWLSKYISRHGWNSSGGAKLPLAENHCSNTKMLPGYFSHNFSLPNHRTQQGFIEPWPHSIKSSRTGDNVL